MIKAIIFDCFGVILTATWAPFREKYFSGDARLLQEAEDATRAVDLGLISRAHYRAILSELSGASSSEVYDALEKGVVVDERMMRMIRKLKKQFKIGMLSSVAPNRLEQFFSEEDRAAFDDLALSYAIGVVKPDPRAYHIAAQRLDVLPDECIFIDDQERNVVAAREQGMHALLYTTYDNLEKEIKELIQ